MAHEHGTHTECGKNFKVFLPAALTRFDIKSNGQLGGRHFGSNSSLYGANLESNAWGIAQGRWAALE